MGEDRRAVVRWHAQVAGFRASAGSVELGTTQIGENLEVDDPQGLIAAALGVACDGVAEHVLLARLAALAPAGALDGHSVQELLDALVAARILIRDRTTALTAHERLLESLAPAGVAGREAAGRLDAARVVVLGAGGVGSWVVDGLARAGVGALVVIDPDRVEASNVRRGCFDVADIGRPKVEVAADRARAVSATVRVATVGAHVDRADDLAELARAADFVVAAADEPSGRAVGRMVAQALVPARVPHVFAAYLGAAVRVGPLWAPTKRRMACAECALASVPPDRIPRTVTAFGLPQAQLTATMAVQASLQELVGGASPLRGRVVVLDPGTGESWRSRVRRDPACEVCGQAVAQHRRTAKGGEVPR